MKKKYRGFQIDLKREKALGGWKNLYLTITCPDGRIFCEFTSAEDPVRDYMRYVVECIDANLAENPKWEPTA